MKKHLYLLYFLSVLAHASSGGWFKPYKAEVSGGNNTPTRTIPQQFKSDLNPYASRTAPNASRLARIKNYIAQPLKAASRSAATVYEKITRPSDYQTLEAGTLQLGLEKTGHLLKSVGGVTAGAAAGISTLGVGAATHTGRVLLEPARLITKGAKKLNTYLKNRQIRKNNTHEIIEMEDIPQIEENNNAQGQQNENQGAIVDQMPPLSDKATPPKYPFAQKESALKSTYNSQDLQIVPYKDPQNMLVQQQISVNLPPKNKDYVLSQILKTTNKPGIKPGSQINSPQKERVYSPEELKNLQIVPYNPAIAQKNITHNNVPIKNPSKFTPSDEFAALENSMINQKPNQSSGLALVLKKPAINRNKISAINVQENQPDQNFVSELKSVLSNRNGSFLSRLNRQQKQATAFAQNNLEQPSLD